MTQKERNLLIQDLCGRFPYGVIAKKEYSFVFTNGTISKSKKIEKLDLEDIEYLISGDDCVDVLKPYLRSMNTMTEEERKELKKLMNCDCVTDYSLEYTVGGQVDYDDFLVYYEDSYKLNDWLNKNMFDHRGLIEKRLALEAPEGMYND
ncbi:MAG: hypothetical protein VZR36_11830 [Prevotella sp.]|nr:hypothetical protein [Prevotella sp.]